MYKEERNKYIYLIPKFIKKTDMQGKSVGHNKKLIKVGHTWKDSVL